MTIAHEGNEISPGRAQQQPISLSWQQWAPPKNEEEEVDEDEEDEEEKY